MRDLSDTLIHEGGDLLAGYLDVHPYVGIGLVALAVLAAGYYLWRRFKARRRDGRFGLPAEDGERT